jgi:hypothetical protein
MSPQHALPQASAATALLNTHSATAIEDVAEPAMSTHEAVQTTSVQGQGVPVASRGPLAPMNIVTAAVANIFTVGDAGQNTGLRVNLPLPDPALRPSDYADISVINTLDGSSFLQGRRR